MSKKLAIKGHPTRGNEVIELLEMMGGCSPIEAYKLYENRCYLINDKGWIVWDYIGSEEIDKYEIFTLEEFLEKYPYKVGDKAIYEDDNDIVVITKIMWDNTVGDIFYNVKRIDENDCFLCPPELLKPYKEVINMKDNKLFGTLSNPVKTKSYTVGLKDGKVIDNLVDAAEFMQIGKTVAVCFNTENYENEVELQLGDYEIEVRDGKTYAVKKKSKYPTTYEECCERVNACPTISISYDSDEDMLYNDEVDLTLLELRKLLICRNAYWKIAGKEMGLGKLWEPDWYSIKQSKFGIHTVENQIKYITLHVLKNLILVFPTEEMRDAFYENFKDLIEQCKELL